MKIVLKVNKSTSIPLGITPSITSYNRLNFNIVVFSSIVKCIKHSLRL